MPDFSRWGANGGDASLNAIARTDRYLDSLAFEQPVYATDPADAELANLMAGWRDDVRRPPAAVITQQDAEFVLARAVGVRRRTRTSVAVLGSTAAALLCLGGFGAVVYGAGPGDALYGLRTSLFGEQQITRDDQVALAAQTEMRQVQQLIDEGDWTAAQDKLETITSTVHTVEDPQRQQELQQQLNNLTVKVEQRDPAATAPAVAPLDPAAPVGPGTPGIPVPDLPPSDALPLPSLPPFELPVPLPGPGVPPIISLPQIPLPKPLPDGPKPLPLPDAPEPLPLPDAPKPLPLPDAPKPAPDEPEPAPAPKPAPKPAPEEPEPAPAPKPPPAPKPAEPAPAPKPVEPAPAPEAPPKLAPAPVVPEPAPEPAPAPKPAPGLAPPQEKPPESPSTTILPIPAQKPAGGGE